MERKIQLLNSNWPPHIKRVDNAIIVPPTDVGFVNTQYFREDALHFKKYGYYCGAPRGSSEYKQFWDDRILRCTEGYSVGGVRITGYHYFYLNFCPITRLPDMHEYGDAVQVDAEKDFPAFWDGDWLYFNAVEACEQMGKHLLVLKARGKGFSFKGGSMCVRNMYLYPGSKSYCFAYEKEYLIKDGVLTKAWSYLPFLNQHTAWRKARHVKDTEMHKRASLLRGREEVGYMSEIIGMAYKDNPRKVRGKRGKLIQWEEFGAAPGAHLAWNRARKSVEQGRFTRGIMIGYGTGGEEGADFEAMQTMFLNPDSYNLMTFDMPFEDGEYGRKAFFFPDYWNKEGFMDADGNSDCRAAAEYNYENWAKALAGGDTNAYIQMQAEECHTPAQAMMTGGGGFLPSEQILRWRGQVLTDRRLLGMGVHGSLWDTGDQVTFKPGVVAPGHKLCEPLPFPRPQEFRGSGCLTIFETPFVGENGKVPDDLYFICHDPFAYDKAKDSINISAGAAFVIKRVNRFSKPDDVIVAEYVARPDSHEAQDDYNAQLFALAKYYNAKIAFENDRGDVIGYAKRKNMTGYLMSEFEYIKKQDGGFARVLGRNFGMSINDGSGFRKKQGLIWLRNWLLRPRGINLDTEQKVLTLETIYSIHLLQELAKYKLDGNFDRVSALIVGMYAMQEFEAIALAPDNPSEEEASDSFFSRDLF